MHLKRWRKISEELEYLRRGRSVLGGPEWAQTNKSGAAIHHLLLWPIIKIDTADLQAWLCCLQRSLDVSFRDSSFNGDVADLQWMCYPWS